MASPTVAGTWWQCLAGRLYGLAQDSPAGARYQRRSEASALRARSPVDDMEGKECKVVLLIKPRAREVIEPQSGSSGKRQGVDYELGDRLFAHRVWLVVKDMDMAVADLEEFSTPFPGFYLYYPQRRHASPALRALVDYLRRVRRR
jgi:hypothetical protein